MNFKELYDNNRDAIGTLLTSMWCGDARGEGQRRQTAHLKQVIEELFAPQKAEPVVQCMNLYKGVHSVTPEVAKGLVGDLWKESYAPYEHQYRCWNALLNKRTPGGKPMSICVTTGTGSGKTECFMMPLVHDLIGQGKGGQIQALFLYPLNALMEDQKSRLEKMLAGTNLTYAVYNGDLPEKEPAPNEDNEEAKRLKKRIAQLRGEYKDAEGNTQYRYEHLLYTREQIRETPPNILLTNPTMLEYILLRQADATLIDPAQKSLRWVAIDETHSYTGAGAAELAMLLRRVLLAFDVKAEDVRFATSSATFGNAATAEEAEAEKAKLRTFIGGITGLEPEQVEVVDGVRMGEENIDDNADKPLWQTICRKDYVSLGELFPEGTVSEKLGKLEEMCRREDALAKDAAKKMKVKVHYFYRVPNNGLYVRLTEQKDGCLKIYAQNALAVPDGDAPLLELSRCKRCGGFVAVAQYDTKSGEYGPRMADDSDMFDIEEPEVTEKDATKPLLLGITSDGVTMGDGNVLYRVNGSTLTNLTSEETGGDGPQSEGWQIVGNTSCRCPYCNAKVSRRAGDPTDDAADPESERFAKLQRFRLSSEVISRFLAPSILGQLEKNAPADGELVFHDGQQYISFVDSRQAAAISTLKQNLDQEKVWVYSTIFHELCRRKAEESAIGERIAALKRQRNETDNEDEEERISDEIKALRKKLSGCMGWMEIFELLYRDKYCNEFLKMFAKRSVDSEEADSEGEITDFMKIKYVHSVMAEYLTQRPNSAPSPETLGLFHATYPQLQKVALPESVKAFNALLTDEAKRIDEKEWRDLLQIFLDHTVRSNQSVFFRAKDGQNGDLKLDIFMLNRFATEKPHRRPVKKPHVNEQRLGNLPRIATYLGALLSGSGDMGQIRNAVRDNLAAVNAVLDDLWVALTRDDVKLIEWGSALYDKKTMAFEDDKYDKEKDKDEPYRMNLVRLSFKLYDNVRLCDVYGDGKVKCLRPVATVFKDFSLYPTRTELGKIEGAPETWQTYPYYRGSGETVDVARLHAWVADNRKLLCDGGIWGEGGFYSNRLDEIYLGPNLFVQAEHTAQVDKEVSRTLLTDFKAHRINILACSTTMEMGVDLGNLEVVMLSSVPPMPANYKQRAGRSGRNNKVRSVCLTLCGSDPVGLRTLFSPIERIIMRPVEVPKVDLESEQVVKRHVNAFLIRAFGVFGDGGTGGSMSQKVVDFFTPYSIRHENGNTGRLIVRNGESFKVDPRGGMGDVSGTRYQRFLDKCADEAAVAELRPALASLLRGTCYARADDLATVVAATRETLERCYGELCAKVEDIKYAYEHQARDSTKFQTKLEMQYIEVLGDRLIGHWATHRFTPNANMPVNVLALDLNSSRDTFRKSFSSNPSYSLREAISQYVPGNCVVVDGIVYKVRGIEFRNMYNPSNTFKTIQHNSEIVKIGEPVPAPVVWPINGKTDLTLVTPTGFLPDFNEDYTRIIDDNVYTHVSAQLIGATEWSEDDGVKMLSVRTNREDSGEAKILYYNEGTGFGYCFCSKCGRMVLETEAAEEGSPLPAEMNDREPKEEGDPRYHFAISGKKFRSSCIGSKPTQGVYRNVIIGDAIQTDYSEIRLRDSKGGKWIGKKVGNEQLLYTLAIAFSQSLVEVLGKERGAVDFAITPTGRICIFDVNPGGAGYSNQLKDETVLAKVVAASKKLLEEARDKDAADILLDKFTIRHLKYIDVKNALDWLSSVDAPAADSGSAGVAAEGVAAEDGTRRVVNGVAFRMLSDEEAKGIKPGPYCLFRNGHAGYARANNLADVVGVKED